MVDPLLLLVVLLNVRNSKEHSVAGDRLLMRLSEREQVDCLSQELLVAFDGEVGRLEGVRSERTQRLARRKVGFLLDGRDHLLEALRSREALSEVNKGGA